MTNIIGPSFEELSNEEMQTIQGSGDVQAETTPVCAIAATAAASSGICAATGGGIATGVTVVVSLKHC
ncbi:mersacidin family lantibiotic [Priestia megaterium]|uniref:lichenicidin A2 family type 2 lantibiotic n=1 Tax=Priestia megaterium TaxID=1404 RepID=UPI000BFA184D|nr:mersacidin family lantibiotic [Priestia megaterium]AUO14643.1 type 2 lantibiotic [Priestia megaterium]PFJ96600.1 type 2 lantibiotic [Priestia megaterium]